ncbi:MAG: type II secretion system protein [Candidatus Omnitrophica bacterium]|nr:type II secretion system protein [Candidatus Omnitrophota bacterium]
MELLLVTVVVAILALMGIPQYLRMTERVRGVEIMHILGAIRAAQNRYKAQSPNAVYADQFGDIDVEVSGLRFWNSTPTTFTGESASFARNGGAYSNQTLGIIFSTGDNCGTYIPVLGVDIECP